MHEFELGREIERDQVIRWQIALAIVVAGTALVASAQSPSALLPSSRFARSSGLQSWQNPGIQSELAKCKTPPKPFSIPINQSANAKTAPADPVLPATHAIPGVLAPGQSWRVVYGLSKIAYRDLNTAGAVSRSKNGALFVAERGLGSAIEELEPQRKMLANSFHGEPLDCVGGVLKDLTADRAEAVYFSVTGGPDSGTN